MYTVTFREMEKAALALLTANTEKKCEFSTYIGHLLSQPSVQEYLLSSEYLAGKLPIDQAQCDHQAGWRNFSLNELGKTPNICSNHLTGDILLFFGSRYTPHCLFSRRHCRVQQKFAMSTGRGKWCREVTKPRKSIEKRKYAPFSEYREVGRWATGPDSTLEPREIDSEIHVLMKKYMQDSHLMQTPAHEQLSTDKALWKQNSLEYHDSRTDEMIHMFDCLLKYRCKCKAKVRIITGRGYKRLEFSGTNDEISHADDKSTSLKYNQIVAIHDAVLVAQSQSAAVLRRNLMQAKGSPEQHKHMDPTQLRDVSRLPGRSWSGTNSPLLAFPNPLASSLGGARHKISTSL